MKLRLIDPPTFKGERKPGDCWYARLEWRCKTCGCMWHENPPTDFQPDGSWSLYGDSKPGPCCENEMDLEPVYFWWGDGARRVKPADSPYAEIAPEHADKHPMIVVLPNGMSFCLHSPTYEDGKRGSSGWRVTGELPNVTVSPSIDYAKGSPYAWHGHIKNGLMQ